MSRPPEPELLRTFVAIVEHGTFTNAAARVHRTQAAVSMQIRRLEALLECSLFEPDGRTKRLTRDGERFYDHARRILGAYRDAAAVIGRDELEGEITVGLPDDYAGSYMPPVLSAFNRAYPWMRLNLVCEPSRSLMGKVADGVIDLALVTEGEGAASGVIVRREPLVWATSANHDIQHRDPLPLAVFHMRDVFQRYAIERLHASGRASRVVVTSVTFAGIASALDAGIAVGVLFRASVRDGWRILDNSDGFPDLPDIGIVLQRSAHEPTRLVDRLAEHITRGLHDLP